MSPGDGPQEVTIYFLVYPMDDFGNYTDHPYTQDVTVWTTFTLEEVREAIRAKVDAFIAIQNPTGPTQPTQGDFLITSPAYFQYFTGGGV